MKEICWNANTFCNKANDPKSQNTLDIPDFSLTNKIFCNSLCVFMHLCMITSALLYLLPFLSLHKSLVYPPFVYILYDQCSEDVTREHSSAKYQWRDWWGTLGAIAPPSKEKLLFLKEYKLSRINFWPATEKCYYVSILSGCQKNS